ncbi:MAG: sialidase family protein, partial [Acidobacteriota bacterium]
MEREKSDVGPREFLRRTMRAVATFFMTAVIGSLPAAAAIPAHKPNTPAKSRRAAAVKVLSALKIDPYGKMDPLDQFETWRRQNRVSLPVTPPIWQAHLTWVNYRKQRTRLKKGTVSGAQFNARSSRKAPILPTASVGTNMPLAGGVQGYQGEVTIAVNPNNSNQLVAGANTFYQDPAAACQAPSGTTYGTQALYGSNDGGASWTYNCAPWPSNDTGGVGSTYFGSDPTVAWDANGNAYATYMLISQSSGGSSSSSIVIAKSTDAGATWNPLGIVINDLNNSSSFDDKEMMAIDTTSGQAHSHTNRIYVIWDQNNVERVAYSDNGTSWTTVVVETGGNSDIGGDLAVAPDGTVYAIWDRLPSTGDTHVFAKSTDGGATWSTPVQIAAGNLTSFSNNDPPAQNSRGINAFGSIAVDRDPGSPYYGTIYVVYPDFPSGGTVNGTNIYLTKSADGGSTWSTPLKVNDDSATHTQFFPWVTVDQSSGAVY